MRASRWGAPRTPRLVVIMAALFLSLVAAADHSSATPGVAEMTMLRTGDAGGTPAVPAITPVASTPQWEFSRTRKATVLGVTAVMFLFTGALVMQFGGMPVATRVKLFVCIPGIVVPLIVYAYAQERVMQTAYVRAEDSVLEYFSKSWVPVIVLASRLGASIFAFGMLLYSGEPLRRSAPLFNYALVSVSNVCATMCQYLALKYISFGMQSLLKCSKILCVMLWSRLIAGGRRYRSTDYVVVAVVTLGAFVFYLSGNVGTTYDEAMGVSSGWGLLLMGGYLLADGLTSTLQEKIFRGYRLTHYNQMLHVNLCSSVLAASLLLLRRDKAAGLIPFLSDHPRCLMDIGALVVCQIIAQNFIYMMINNFGAILFATIVYARQLLSIIFNTLWFGDEVTPVQSLVIAAVFAALFLRSGFVQRMFAMSRPQRDGDLATKHADGVEKTTGPLANVDPPQSEGDDIEMAPMSRQRLRQMPSSSPPLDTRASGAKNT